MNTLEREPECHVLAPCKGTMTFHMARYLTESQVTPNIVLDIRVKEGKVLRCSITLGLLTSVACHLETMNHQHQGSP